MNIKSIISKCVTDIIDEGFDPQSNGTGPNMESYEDQNARMRKMEEGVFDAKHKSEIVIKKEPHGISVTPFNPIGDVAGGGLLHFSYGDQEYNKAIQMANHLKSKYPKYKVVDLIGTEVSQLIDPDAGESAQWDSEKLNEGIELISLEKKDMWGRPMYQGNDGKIYKDISCGKGTPEIHDTTEYGEPSIPIRNYTIKDTSSEYSHSPEMRVRSDEPSPMNEDSTCQKCKGEGHYTHKFGMDKHQIVPCDFPGCHNGIVNHEENFRQWGIPNKDVTDYKTACEYLLRHGFKHNNLPPEEDGKTYIKTNNSSWWGWTESWLNARFEPDSVNETEEICKPISDTNPVVDFHHHAINESITYNDWFPINESLPPNLAKTVKGLNEHDLSEKIAVYGPATANSRSGGWSFLGIVNSVEEGLQKYPNAISMKINSGEPNEKTIWTLKNGNLKENDKYNYDLKTAKEPYGERKCKCGKTFTPSYGEFHRCPSCMGDQLDAAEQDIADNGGMVTEAGTVNPTKISTGERNKIGNSLRKVGLDGNGRFESQSGGLGVLSDALKSVGFSLNMVTGISSASPDKGNQLLSFRRTNDEGQDIFTDKPTIENSRISYSWENLERPGLGNVKRFEILAYVS